MSFSVLWTVSSMFVKLEFCSSPNNDWPSPQQEENLEHFRIHGLGFESLWQFTERKFSFFVLLSCSTETKRVWSIIQLVSCSIIADFLSHLLKLLSTYYREPFFAHVRSFWTCSQLWMYSVLSCQVLEEEIRSWDILGLSHVFESIWKVTWDLCSEYFSQALCSSCLANTSPSFGSEVLFQMSLAPWHIKVLSLLLQKQPFSWVSR